MSNNKDQGQMTDNTINSHNSISDKTKYDNKNQISRSSITNAMQRKSMFKANVSGASSLRMYRLLLIVVSSWLCLMSLTLLLLEFAWYWAIIPLVVALGVLAIGRSIIKHFLPEFKTSDTYFVVCFIILNILTIALGILPFIFQDWFERNITHDAKIYIAIISFIFAILLIIIQAVKWSKAKEQHYYFYYDMIEFSKKAEKATAVNALYGNSKKEKANRDTLHVLHGIVDVEMDMPLSKHKHNVINSLVIFLSSIFSFNSRPIWKNLCGFRTITISPTGHPDDDILLVDVENPAEVIENIKKHYPSYTNETIGKTFHL